MPSWNSWPWVHTDDDTTIEPQSTTVSGASGDTPADQFNSAIRREDEAALVHAASEGNEEAFAQIVNLYQWMVYQLALRLVRDSDEAADISQDVFVAAWKGLSTFRGDASLKTWLHSITYHRCLRVLENQQHRMVAISQFANQQVERLTSAWSVMQSNLAEQQWCQAIQEQIELLPAKYQTVLNLRHMQDKTYEEIAQTLALSINNVKSQLFRARAMLRDRLQDLEQHARENSDILNQRLQGLATGWEEQFQSFLRGRVRGADRF
jgi:RNA polymerase sigma-70 factor, ECF subfamily